MPSFEELIPEEENIEKEGEPLKTAREQADDYLENFEFVKEEEIIRINPENPKSEMPVFFSPGWGVTETSKSIMEAIGDEGRKVISTFFTREEKIVNNGEKEDIPIAELQKALAIIETIEKSGVDKVDAIGHSEGGLNLVIAASLYPEKFRNIVLIAPAGMMKNDSYLNLVKRFTIDETFEEVKKSDKININSFYSYLKDVFRHVLKNPILSNKEIKAMTQMDIFEMTKQLKEKGVGVGLVCGAYDKVFPIEEVIKNADRNNIDCFLPTKGHHGSAVFDKEYITLAENLLDNMARKKE